MNWETTYRDIGVSSLPQTATELQLIVRLFSVRDPAIQLGFGGRKFRHQLEVTLFLFLVCINIYIHVLIHLNPLVRTWEKAAPLGLRGAGVERRVYCGKVCRLWPMVREVEGFWVRWQLSKGYWVTLWRAISSSPSWSASSSPFATPSSPWRQGIECFHRAGLSAVFHMNDLILSSQEP